MYVYIYIYIYVYIYICMYIYIYIYVYIYIYIQKYGLDIIYHTVYGLHYMLYFYNVVPELYQLFIPSLCL